MRGVHGDGKRPIVHKGVHDGLADKGARFTTPPFKEYLDPW